MAGQSHQILIGFFLISLAGCVLARHDYAPIIVRPDEIPVPLDEYGNVDDVYMDVRRPPELDLNFLAKWPTWKDIFPMVYEANTNKIPIHEMQYQDMPEILPTPLPIRRDPGPKESGLKNQGQKKNSYALGYMSACHFKICNMGRKRNVRFVHL